MATKKLIIVYLIGLVGVFGPSVAYADSHHQWSPYRAPEPGSHAGEVDTDGILSRGEVPNSRIDYDRVQRQGARWGDYRVQNPYNYAQAREDREDKGRYNYGNDELRYDRPWRRNDYRDDNEGSRHHWWNW